MNYFIELYSSFELLLFFCWRDFLVRYRQAYFGIAWALIRPLLNMALFTYFFGRLAGLPSQEINYPLFVLAGMLPWQLFANSISENSLCLINNTNLITKVYFPRMILPMAQIIVQMVDFLINLLLVFLLSLFMSALNFKTLIFLPLSILLTLILTAGTGLWLSAITVFYRDVRFIVPFLVQFGMFLSPVGYGSFVIQGAWKRLYYLNPLVGLIDSYRYAFFGITYPDMPVALLFSALFSILILISGFMFFRRVETFFADNI